jgi:hypothetical protein
VAEAEDRSCSEVDGAVWVAGEEMELGEMVTGERRINGSEMLIWWRDRECWLLVCCCTSDVSWRRRGTSDVVPPHWNTRQATMRATFRHRRHIRGSARISVSPLESALASRMQQLPDAKLALPAFILHLAFYGNQSMSSGRSIDTLPACTIKMILCPHLTELRTGIAPKNLLRSPPLRRALPRPDPRAVPGACPCSWAGADHFGMT